MKQNKPFSAKRLLSAFVALAMCLSLLPVVPAGAAGADIYVSKSGNDLTGNGSQSAPYNRLEKALEKASDNDTIHIMDSVMTDQTSQDDPLIIDKSVTIIGDSSESRISLQGAGIILGKDVTFQNLIFNFSNPVRNAIIANGYTLKLNNVQKYTGGASTPFSIHVFAGSLSDTSKQIPAEGPAGRIEIYGDVSLGDIHAGGLSDIADADQGGTGSNQFTKNSTIVLGSDMSGTIGTIYGGGASESRGSGTGDALHHDASHYSVTGQVDILIQKSSAGFKDIAIDGSTGGSTSATVTYESNYQSAAGLQDIKNISELYIKKGIFGLGETSDINSFAATTIRVDGGQRLELHSLWTNLTVAEFHGSGESNPAKLTLSKNQTLTVTGAASGATRVGIGGFNSSDASWDMAVLDQTYISAASSSTATFELAPHSSQSGKSFEFNDTPDNRRTWAVPSQSGGGGGSSDPSRPISFQFASNTATVSTQNRYVEVPISCPIPGDGDISNVPFTIQIQHGDALPVTASSSLEAYGYTYSSEELGFEEIYAFWNDETSQDGFAITVSTSITPGVYKLIVSVETAEGTQVSDTLTLTVTSTSIPPSADKTSLTISNVTLAPKTYDNTNTATVQSVTFSGLQGDSLVKDIDYTASAYFTDINAGTNKTANVTVSLLDTAKTKYVLPNGTFTLSGQTINKANQQTPSSVSGSYAVSTTSASKFTYTATLISGAEYKMDAAGQWQNSNVFDNIEPLSSHTFYARMKATTNYNESPDANTGAVIFNKLPNSTKPALQVTLSGDSSNRTVTIAPVTGAEYSFDGGRNYSESNSQSGFRGQVNVAIRYKETATLNASEATSEVVNTDKQMQAALSIDPIGNKTYGDPSFTLSARGGSTASDVTFSSTDPTIVRIDGATATILKTGTVTITATKAGDASYNPVSVTVDITVNKAALTVKANDQQITMGASIPVLTFTATGLVNGDTFTAPDYDTSAVNVNIVGQYPIAISGGILSNADCYTVTYQPGTLTVAAAGAGGGGGGGGGGAAAGGTTDGTTQNADGSTTTTVTDKTTGTVTETTKRTDGSQTVVETKTDGSVTTTETAANGVTGVTATDKNGAVTSAEASVPAAVATQAAQNGQTVTLPVSVPTARTTETAPAVKIAIAGDAGAVKVEIPVAASKPGVVAVIVKADGTEEIVKTSVPTEGGVALTVEGAATVKIIDNSKSFDDVQPNDWYSGVVDFVSARSIFNGTSATTFEPDNSMTRGMLTVVLHNLENNPKSTTLTSDFADVGDDWYADAVRWATDNGIVSGYGDGLFGPDDSITREQLTVMLWRYAGSPVSEYSIAQFSDADQIDPYAQAALAWASENHIINGYSDGRLNPKGEATRAHVAQMLQNFLENT